MEPYGTVSCSAYALVLDPGQVKTVRYGQRHVPLRRLASAELPSDIAADASACPRAASRDLRRKAILDIARDIFLSQGYAATSMSQVAARLGGSKGTLYNYFSSKEELFSAMVVEDCESEFLAMIDFQPTGRQWRRRCDASACASSTTS